MPSGIYKRKPMTLETRQKIRDIALSMGYGKWMIGKKHSEETKEKMRKSHTGRVVSQETRDKIGKSHKDKVVSEETRKKSSESHMGKIPWNKGKKMLPQFVGKNNPNWKGGTTRQRTLEMSRIEYKQWRSNVFERDNWTCQTCNIRGGILNAHHIKSWEHYPELRYDLENGVTLCLECHKLTDNYAGKNKGKK